MIALNKIRGGNKVDLLRFGLTTTGYVVSLFSFVMKATIMLSLTSILEFPSVFKCSTKISILPLLLTFDESACNEILSPEV